MQMLRPIVPVLACTGLAACQDAAPPGNGVAIANQTAEPVHAGAAPVPAPAPAGSSPLGRWVVGSWSFDTSCATDFVIRYEADGSVDNAGEMGRWSLAGDALTETITERLENGGEAPVRLDPPVVRTYAIRRIDATHGVITFENRRVPIQRC